MRKMLQQLVRFMLLGAFLGMVGGVTWQLREKRLQHERDLGNWNRWKACEKKPSSFRPGDDFQPGDVPTSSFQPGDAPPTPGFVPDDPWASQSSAPPPGYEEVPAPSRPPSGYEEVPAPGEIDCKNIGFVPTHPTPLNRTDWAILFFFAIVGFLIGGGSAIVVWILFRAVYFAVKG